MKTKKCSSDAVDHFAAFIDFLHCYGCLEAFMINTLGSFSTDSSRRFLALLLDVPPYLYLDSAFFWDCTPEGELYWRQVDEAWDKYRLECHIF
nr:MAG TPA: hypothetical protein [Microviridae sp.]